MPLPLTTAGCVALIESYFDHIQGSFHYENPIATDSKKNTPSKTEKIWDREPEPALFTGLMLHLGFNSQQEFEEYERKGKHRKHIIKARLRIEKEYERKLHMQAPTGAIFALKKMGWTDKSETTPYTEILPKSIVVEVVQSGPNVAANEKEVEL
ncbi:hypothetical protein FPZ43_15755 [Mucilaginibacter pallidiroseus]|uniref:Uncharacterized protein n=1 Tax=Mucilaginibacter pallidiroseus TaxID=2599295 RepID=A0A563U328_9SPHI|nr:terminase small subunit [Mucilaginibacter pallidiroseus]TWR25740.1 hypothetical protein FPZ43_15755 [Mucilaginibacter pallidiroseus]